MPFKRRATSQGHIKIYWGHIKITQVYFSSIHLGGFITCISSPGARVRLGIYYQNKGQKAEESAHKYLALLHFLFQFMSNKTPGCTWQFCTDGWAQEDLGAKFSFLQLLLREFSVSRHRRHWAPASEILCSAEVLWKSKNFSNQALMLQEKSLFCPQDFSNRCPFT